MKSLFTGRVITSVYLVALAMTMPKTAAQAQDLNFQEYRKFLMQGQGNGGSKKMAIQTSCTTKEGTTYRIGEKGYDTCLSALAGSKNQREISSSKEDSTSPAGVGTTIHFGDK